MLRVLNSERSAWVKKKNVRVTDKNQLEPTATGSESEQEPNEPE